VFHYKLWLFWVLHQCLWYFIQAELFIKLDLWPIDPVKMLVLEKSISPAVGQEWLLNDKEYKIGHH
jgi:hypothetical protein